MSSGSAASSTLVAIGLTWRPAIDVDGRNIPNISSIGRIALLGKTFTSCANVGKSEPTAGT
jgi:hypothetical protein